jgi:hypothetical protein
MNCAFTPVSDTVSAVAADIGQPDDFSSLNRVLIRDRRHGRTHCEATLSGAVFQHKHGYLPG